MDIDNSKEQQNEKNSWILSIVRNNKTKKIQRPRLQWPMSIPKQYNKMKIKPTQVEKLLTKYINNKNTA